MCGTVRMETFETASPRVLRHVLSTCVYCCVAEARFNLCAVFIQQKTKGGIRYLPQLKALTLGNNKRGEQGRRDAITDMAASSNSLHDNVWWWIRPSLSYLHVNRSSIGSHFSGKTKQSLTPPFAARCFVFIPFHLLHSHGSKVVRKYEPEPISRAKRHTGPSCELNRTQVHFFIV